MVGITDWKSAREYGSLLDAYREARAIGDPRCVWLYSPGCWDLIVDRSQSHAWPFPIAFACGFIGWFAKRIVGRG